jgi:hypothetical protein
MIYFEDYSVDKEGIQHKVKLGSVSWILFKFIPSGGTM